MSMRRRAARWKWVCASVAGLILLAYVLTLALNALSTIKWRRYVAALRARGEPVTIVDIESRRSVIADDENSARVIERLYEQLTNAHNAHQKRHTLLFNTYDPKPDMFTGIPWYFVPPTREFVEHQAELLQGLEVVRDKPRGRFAVRWNTADPLSTLFEYAEPLRTAAKLQYVASFLRLVDKEFDKAAEHIEILFLLSGTLYDEPSVIGRVIQLSVTNLSLDALEDALIAGEFDDETLRHFQCLIEHRLESDGIREALLGERAMLVDFFEAIIKGTVSYQSILTNYAATGNPGSALVPPTLPNVVFRENQLKTARLMTELLQVTDDREQFVIAARNVNTQLNSLSWLQFMTKRILAHFDRLIFIHYKSKARLETARCALAWERFRLAHGIPPESWSDLVPEFLDEIPTDPLTDGLLRLKISETGTVFYSVGEDKYDDDAEVTDQVGADGHRWRARDIGFRLLPPEKRGVVILDVPPPEDGD